MEKEILLKCDHIVKTFGPTKALADVPLELGRGEVRGLIGENGSGKSTLTSIIAGVQPYDSGSMEIKGKPYLPVNMIDAQAHGIAMIVQEMATVPHITIAANIFVGKENRFKKGLLINLADMAKSAKEALKKIGVDYIDPGARIDSLNFEDKKIVEIARAMNDDPDILIIDETTTALSHRGRKIIYDIIRKMQNEGKSVLFISHDLDEVMEICTSVTILRDGKCITTLNKNEMDVNKMRTNMIGREISENYYRSDYDGSYSEEVVFKADNITLSSIVKNFSLELHKGEILGLGGLSECGMHEAGRAMFGIDPVLSGSVRTADGTDISSPQVAVNKHIAYVSKNRDQEAVILLETIGDNITLPALSNLQKGFYISPQSEKKLIDEQVDFMGIKCENSTQLVQELSGGNKQKVVFGKWMGNKSEIFILDCPTRGIDVGVKTSMYQLIYDLKKQGKAIIMICEELPELIGMSDRILIMKDGEISKEFRREEKPLESDLIHYMI